MYYGSTFTNLQLVFTTVALPPFPCSPLLIQLQNLRKGFLRCFLALKLCAAHPLTKHSPGCWASPMPGTSLHTRSSCSPQRHIFRGFFIPHKLHFLARANILVGVYSSPGGRDEEPQVHLNQISWELPAWNYTQFNGDGQY